MSQLRLKIKKNSLFYIINKKQLSMQKVELGFKSCKGLDLFVVSV